MILVFGKSPDIMARATAALAAAGHSATPAFTPAEVEARLTQGGITLLAIGGGVPDDERQAAKAAATRAGVTAVDIFGPQTLVPTVTAALDGR